MSEKLTPLQQKIIDALRKRGADSYRHRVNYWHLMRAIWPPDEHPRAWRYSSNGGPPGCAMPFGRAINQLKRKGLVHETVDRAFCVRSGR